VRKRKKDSGGSIAICGLRNHRSLRPIRQLGLGLALMGSRYNGQLMLSWPQPIRARKRVLQHRSRAYESTVLLWDWPAHPSVNIGADPLAVASRQDNRPEPVRVSNWACILDPICITVPISHITIDVAFDIHNIHQQGKESSTGY
jgi:hypothetical protein